MAEVDIIGQTECPWCHTELKVVRSHKSGHHYANCTSCNSHFRNIPIALVDMRGKQTREPESEVRESALEKLRKEFGHKQEMIEGALDRLRRGFVQNKPTNRLERREIEEASLESGDALDRFLRKHSDKQWLTSRWI